MNDEAQAILQFWFGRSAESPQLAAEHAALWWSSSPEQDQEIRDRFLGLHEKAAAGELAHWEHEPYSRLALILLLDQFPRNMFRKTARAFATDAQALTLTQFGVRKAVDAGFDPVERIFFYLPMEHAENSAMQKMNILLMGSLRNEVLPEWKAYVQNAYQFALDHQRVIQRFGRFPHRNAILGRASTPEEIEWLENHASNWGQ